MQGPHTKIGLLYRKTHTGGRFLMADEQPDKVPTVTLDVRVPLSVTFEVVGSRINFVLEEGTDREFSPQSSKQGATGTGKYELYKVEE